MTDTGHPGGTAHDHDEWRDADMLAGVRARDRDALGRFFDVAFPYVFNLAFRLTGSRENAEDVAQEVFLKVHRAADRLDPSRHPKPWVTTITYNACRDLGRRRSARPEHAVDSVDIGERAEAPGRPDDDLNRRENEHLIEAALVELEWMSRAVVILHDYCGFAHDVIASIVDASHSAVRKRYSRALSRMAEIIEGLQK